MDLRFHSNEESVAAAAAACCALQECKKKNNDAERKEREAKGEGRTGERPATTAAKMGKVPRGEGGSVKAEMTTRRCRSARFPLTSALFSLPFISPASSASSHPRFLDSFTIEEQSLVPRFQA